MQQYNTFLLNNYLLKYAQDMLVNIYQFSIKYSNFFYKNKTCTFRLVFLLMFFGEDWRNSYYEYWGGRICYKTFSVKWSWQPLRRFGIISSKRFSYEINLIFLMFCRHFLLSQHSPFWPRRSCLLGDCQLHSID